MRVHGFSLIELMIVLSIAGILSLTLIPQFQVIHNTARELSAKSIARSITIALEQYYFQHQTYPNGENLSIQSIITDLASKRLLSNIPKNPFTGGPYSGGDGSGKLEYRPPTSTVPSYTLVGYGKYNQQIIFSY